jgi:hypothetical protein
MKLVVGKQRWRVAYGAVGASKEPLRATLLHWRQRRIVAGQPTIKGCITCQDSTLVGRQGVRDSDRGDSTVEHLGEVFGVKGARLRVLLASRNMTPCVEIDEHDIPDVAQLGWRYYRQQRLLLQRLHTSIPEIMRLIGHIVQCGRPAPAAYTVASRWHLSGRGEPVLRAVAGRTREGPTAGEVGVEEECLTQGDLHRIKRVEPRLRHLGELCRVEVSNLLAQRRIEGQFGLWRRLGPEMHSDTPEQEEHHEHPGQRQAASSTTIPEYSRVLAALTKNSIHQCHRACPSHSCPRVFSYLTAKGR